MLNHKANLNKFYKVEIISNIFLDHNSMRLEIKDMKSIGKKHKHEYKQSAAKQTIGHWNN